MKYLFLISLLFTSCANVSTSRLVYKNEGSTIVVEIPKEVQAKNLTVKFNAQQGTAEITSESWISTNQGTILSQAEREGKILESSSVFIEKATKGAAEGAMKGLVPIP